MNRPEPLIEVTLTTYFKSTLFDPSGPVWMPLTGTTTEVVDQAYFDNVIQGVSFFRDYSAIDIVTEIDMTNARKIVTVQTKSRDGCRKVERRFVFSYEEEN